METIYKATIANFLDVVPAIGLMGKNTCGSKGCKDGMVESPQKKIQKGNEPPTFEEHIKYKESNIDKIKTFALSFA